MLPKKLIILGGGYSVKEEIEKGLFDWLPNSFCVGLNYSYKFVNTTAVVAVDETFYNTNCLKLNELPLYIMKKPTSICDKPLSDKAITLKSSLKYNRDCEDGIYSSTLAGLYALSLFIKVLDEGEIYLLGYDYGTVTGDCDKHNKLLTHWYQGEVEHRGIGKVNWYNATVVDQQTRLKISQAEKEFRVYKDETKVKIYNVGLKSNIPETLVQKISYEQFFTLNETNRHNQDELRIELRNSLWALKQEKNL
jgi:hypothetical protein